ncbi:MAG: ABC transporter permease [Veillonella sp.]|nr:ABC transporter permease [Veillonella sp.]
MRWLQLKCMIQKELISLFKDPRLRFIIVMGVIIQGFLFGYAANYDLLRAPYVVVDQSKSQASREVINHINGTGLFQQVAGLGNVNGVAPMIESEQAIMAVVFPPDFADHVNDGSGATVQVILDGRNPAIAGRAESYVATIVSNYNAQHGLHSPVDVVTRTWFNPNQLSRWTFLPSLIAMISFIQILMLSGMSVAKEREQGTFDQLLVTPLTQAEILVGKAVAPMLVGILQSFLLFLLSRFWFQVPLAGSVWTILLVIAVFSLSATGFGLILSSIAKNMQQVLVYILVTVLPLVLLSGVTTPIHNMPMVLQYITYADPLRFAVDAVRRIYLEGAGLSDVAFDFVPMLAVAVVTLPIAAWLFRNKTQ